MMKNIFEICSKEYYLFSFFYLSLFNLCKCSSSPNPERAKLLSLFTVHKKAAFPFLKKIYDINRGLFKKFLLKIILLKKFFYAILFFYSFFHKSFWNYFKFYKCVINIFELKLWKGFDMMWCYILIYPLKIERNFIWTSNSNVSRFLVSNINKDKREPCERKKTKKMAEKANEESL